MTQHAGVLSGIRVLDLSRNAPGPYCTMLLADMGADVVVVGGGRSGLPVDELCRGKRMMTLDLKSAGGKSALHELVLNADVVVEGFRPGVADRLGAGYRELSALNPRLVYCSITGYGQEGPLGQVVGHDINYLSLTGFLGAMGPTDGPPVPPLNLLADFGGGGMLAALGIVSALFERERSGKGQHIDAAMIDGVISMMAMHYADWGNPVLPSRGAGLLSGEAPFYRCYECADGGYVAVGALEDAFFKALWTGMGFQHPPEHMERENWPAIEKALAAAFLTRGRDDWTAHFAGQEACVSAVLDPDEVWTHPHIQERFGKRAGQVPAVPVFSRTSGHEGDVDLTDDTNDILREAGLNADQIDAARGEPVAVQGLRWPPL